MQMVAMIAVRVRPQRYPEAAAAGLVNGAKETAHILVLAVPALLDRDPPPVLQHESADIDGIGAAMLAELGAGHSVDRPAAIGAQAFDPLDRGLQPLLRGRLHRLASPARELPGGRTGHGAEIVHRRADLRQLHGAESAAAAGKAPVRKRAESDLVLPKFGVAQQSRPVGARGLRLAGLADRRFALWYAGGGQQARRDDPPPHGPRLLCTESWGQAAQMPRECRRSPRAPNCPFAVTSAGRKT